MDLTKSIQIAAAGMQAQGIRMRTIAENLANADSLATSPGADPYRRKTVSFRNVLDKTLGANVVKVDRIDLDRTDFRTRWDPTHPSADRDGQVKLPNVNSIIEVMDMRQAQRSYEANLGVVETVKTMIARAIDLLRS